MSVLFVYGTLCFPGIVLNLTGKTFHSEQAVLKGFQRMKVRNADYPAIIKYDQSEVKGIVLSGIDDQSMLILNYFEGDDYRCEELEIYVNDSKIKAIVYVWNSDLQKLENIDWNINEFSKNSLQTYIEKVIPDTLSDFNERFNI